MSWIYCVEENGKRGEEGIVSVSGRGGEEEGGRETADG
jgi:hypothetical protein